MQTTHFSGRRLGAILLVIALFSLPVLAQERVGQISGTARDASGAVLPNVNITLTNKETGRTYTTKSATDGVYFLRDLDPARYTLKFELQGFATREFADVLVLVGKNLTINVDLAVGGTQQTVEVTADAPLIDTTSTAVGHNVTAEEFSRLPKTRSFQSMANAAPSVNVGDVVEGGIQINGASGSENQFNVDGLSTNSLIEGHSRQNAAFEILQEVQVKTSGIEAQYGGALGGVISAITRSGGNEFHGDVHYYFSGNAISAGQVQRLLMDPNDLKTVTYQQDYKNPVSTHEVGYSLGGYFLKNRLYFFSAASPSFRTRERDYIATDGMAHLKEDSKSWQAYNKVSVDITRSMRASIGYLWSPSSAEGVIAAFDGYGNQRLATVAGIEANQVRGYFSPQANYNANLDWALSPTSLLSIKAARFWDNYKALGVPDISPIEWGKPSTDIPGIPAAIAQPAGFQTIPRVTMTAYDVATRNLIQADFSKFVNFGGGHDFKVGIGRQKNVNRVNSGVYGGGGYITLHWGSQLELPDGRLVGGQYGYYQFDQQGTIGSTGGTIDHIYFQDRWRVTQRLTLDLGLRMENEVIPSFRRDVKDYAFQFGWGKKLAPRLGGAYDLFGDGRVKLYASWGLFYDWVKYELARGTFGGDVWRTFYRPLDSLDPNVILKLGNGNLPGNNLWVEEFQDWRIPAFGPEQLDPDINPMSSMITNAGVEWQLRPNLVVAARYTRNSLRDTIEDIGTMLNGSEVYIYANPGRGLAKMSSPSGITPAFELPRPKRIYDAMELSFTRRFSNRWFASGSYVWSRLYGNYAGLQNSDEIFPGGTNRGSLPSQAIFTNPYRPGTSASRAYDLDYYNYDSHGNQVYGRLASDRPHVLKLYGSYTLPSKIGETEIGGFFYAGSGTPVSTLVQDVQNVPLFVNGRGDLGRTPILNQTDLLVAHEVRVSEGKRLRFEFNAQNLFNQKISRYTYSFYNRFRIRSSGINLFNTNFQQGYDYLALQAAAPDTSTAAGSLDPRFGFADNFNTGFAGRFGVKFIF